MSAPVIEIENLSKDYETGFWKKRRVRALDRLSLTVGAGETFGFLGPNGAGKTTTLKILMRLMFPTEGRARILGHDIADRRMHARIGYLPERPYFYDYLTPREFMEYCAELFGFQKDARRRRAEELLALVHLEEKSWDKQMRKLSKGMLQRVGLAQALINDPEILFLDEPMSGLDPIGRREVRDLIAAQRARGATVFFSSHILSDIEVLCDRAAILRGGRLDHIGTLEELRARGGSGRMEITFAGDSSRLAMAFKVIEEAHTTPTPGGVRVEIEREQDVDAVIARARDAGARLVAVNSIGGSLEELFMNAESDKTKTAREHAHAVPT
jgi:ABC-2 type transport system ATP-binding protein